MKPPPTSPEAAFDRFWRAYPARRPNPKTEARKIFERLVKKGVDPEDLVRGALGYAVEVRRLKIDEPFVCQAKTFLRQERWTDYQEVETEAQALAAMPHRELFAPFVERGVLKESALATWLAPLHFEKLPGAAICIVTAPTVFHRDWVRANFSEVLQAALKAREIRFEVGRK